MQHGIQIHDGGNHFQTAIHLSGKGVSGIDLVGSLQVGLNLHNNNIRLGEGWIEFRYRNNCIEVLKGVSGCLAASYTSAARRGKNEGNEDLKSICPSPAHDSGAASATPGQV
jgi:hypothetical protein